MAAYKLSSTLCGHEGDVRAVANALHPHGAILSVSRDRSCRLWTRNENDNNFTEGHMFLGHSGYIASCCVIPPSEKYQLGLVATGGNDKLILIFDFDSFEPIQKLEGHTDTVCSLAAGNFGMLVSGSWDRTAKVWLNGSCVLTLTGHEAAVWSVCVLPDRGVMFTASADKTIKMWRAGKCENTFSGHTDCVRGLVLLNEEHILSCSNDGTIRQWRFSGECVHVYQGHTNYIYSISRIPGTQDAFVSSGEDRTIKVWKDGESIQTITLPCQSIWSVTVLQNGDVVAGGSDALVRVFSVEPSRQASKEAIKAFEDEVGNQAIPAAANLDLGEIKTDQLPGPEGLLNPGSKKDQTKLIKRNGIVEAHQWDDANNRWQKIGDVTGAAGKDGSQRTSEKTSYLGKEYDFVFDVDIEEGKPPLKLPFNITDDPWVAAHKFLEQNELSATFLDEVANFILKNAKGVTLGDDQRGYMDPFTGGNRYVPGTSNPTNGTLGSDPFTGSGRYVPSNSETATTTSKREVAHACYIPETKYLRFASGKSSHIVKKIKEFNALVSQETSVTDNELEIISDCIDNILCGGSQVRVEMHGIVIATIRKLSTWPHDKLLPVLDTLRILLLCEDLSNILFDSPDDLISRLSAISLSDATTNTMLVYRIITNAFCSVKSSKTVYANKHQFLEQCAKICKTKSKNVCIAASSFIANCCIHAHMLNVPLEDRISLCTCIVEFLPNEMDDEATFRLLVALGTLLDGNLDMKSFARSLDVSMLLKKIKDHSSTQKINECCTAICDTLS